MPTVNDAQENLFMPSRWVRRVSPNEAVSLHVEVTTRESEAVKADFPCQLGVATGENPGDKLDIFNPQGASGKLVIYVSGGYWQELSGEISAYTVKPLVQEDHTVAVVYYVRAPGQNMAEMVDQVERAFSWCLGYASQTKQEIWLTGHSAGSQLCNMVLTSHWFQNLKETERKMFVGIINFSGVFMLQPLLSTSVNTVLELTDKEALEYSPGSKENVRRMAECKHLKHVTLVGEFDSPAFIQQAQDYHHMLKAAGCDSTYTLIEDVDHFSMVELMAQPSSVPSQIVLKAIEDSQ